jgi:hypothetical protein
LRTAFRKDSRHFLIVKLSEPHKTFCRSNDIFLQGGGGIVGGIFANKGGQYGDSEYLVVHSHGIMQVA